MLRTGAPDRGCIVKYEDDSSEDFTVYMRSEGVDHGPYFIPKDQAELVSYEGWDKFVDFEPGFRHNEGATRQKNDWQLGLKTFSAQPNISFKPFL